MSLAWYSVRLETHQPADEREVTLDDDVADDLMTLLVEHDGIVASGAGSWSATISVSTTDAVEALAVGSGVIKKLAAKAGIPPWPITRAEAIRQDIVDAENSRPTLPGLVSAPEAADILSVSPQRLHELAAHKPNFPDPIYELRAGKLWLREAIEDFGRRWDRKPGRPRHKVGHKHHLQEPQDS